MQALQSNISKIAPKRNSHIFASRSAPWRTHSPSPQHHASKFITESSVNYISNLSIRNISRLKRITRATWERNKNVCLIAKTFLKLDCGGHLPRGQRCSLQRNLSVPGRSANNKALKTRKTRHLRDIKRDSPWLRPSWPAGRCKLPCGRRRPRREIAESSWTE